MSLWHYVIPSSPPGRWLVVYRLPGIDGWEAPVADCRTEQMAFSEAERLNGTCGTDPTCWPAHHPARSTYTPTVQPQSAQHA